MNGSGSSLVLLWVCAAALSAANIPQIDHARELYQRTEYQSSLTLLLATPSPDGDAMQLIGQNYFMLADYKKASDAFDRALMLGNMTEQVYVWAGRAYGRRAETSNPFAAAGLASHARKYFETAVAMNILDKEATGDLLDYYVGAPGFMGGGMDRARELAAKVAAADPAEGQHMFAVLAEHDKDYGDAEQHLRRAIQLAPKQAMRIMELARFIARRGRFEESDSLFEQAVRLAPGNPQIMFYRAQADIEAKRSLNDARTLLEAYVRAPLTPEDPPRQKAQDLLAKVASK